MTAQNKIRLFEQKLVRSVWDDEQEKWFVSVIDTVEVLTGSANPRRYWSDLKIKLQAEGSELYDFIVQLKMKAPDGKMRLTDVADIEQLFRLIQFSPFPLRKPSHSSYGWRSWDANGSTEYKTPKSCTNTPK